MTYKGVYRAGVIVVSGDVDLHEGEPVRISREASPAKKKAVKVKPKAEKSPAKHPVTKLAGIWKDRKDWRGLTSLEVLERIRSGHSGAKPVKMRKGARG